MIRRRPLLRKRAIEAIFAAAGFVVIAMALVVVGRSMPADALDVVAQPYGEGCRADRPQFEAPCKPHTPSDGAQDASKSPTMKRDAR